MDAGLEAAADAFWAVCGGDLGATPEDGVPERFPFEWSERLLKWWRRMNAAAGLKISIGKHGMAINRVTYYILLTTGDQGILRGGPYS